VPVISLPSETWRAVVDALRSDELPAYMAEHADRLERDIDRHPPDAPAVSLSLSDDVYLRSYNWARLQLDIPLPPAER
jgi:hypothetical protein